MRILAIFGAVLAAALLIFVGAAGQRWMAAREAAATPPPAAAKVASEAASGTLDPRALGELLAVVDARRRAEILGSADAFQQFVHTESLNQAVLKAAYANHADANPQIATLMTRAGQRVLVEAYLNQVVRVNLDPKFPSEAQVREAYDKNTEAFRVPERIHLWQIFIPLDTQASDAAVKAAWADAERISAQLRAGKGDFAELAKRYSAHEASRINDGYMGLLKVTDLLPPIAAAVKKLDAGEISEPIASESGLHVIKRGATVAAEQLDFARVKDQLKARLLQEAALKVRQAAVDKIEGDYPVTEPPRNTVERWRQRLLASAAQQGAEQDAAKTPAKGAAKAPAKAATKAANPAG